MIQQTWRDKLFNTLGNLWFSSSKLCKSEHVLPEDIETFHYTPASREIPSTGNEHEQRRSRHVVDYVRREESTRLAHRIFWMGSVLIIVAFGVAWSSGWTGNFLIRQGQAAWAKYQAAVQLEEEREALVAEIVALGKGLPDDAAREPYRTLVSGQLLSIFEGNKEEIEIEDDKLESAARKFLSKATARESAIAKYMQKTDKLPKSQLANIVATSGDDEQREAARRSLLKMGITVTPESAKALAEQLAAAEAVARWQEAQALAKPILEQWTSAGRQALIKDLSGRRVRLDQVVVLVALRELGATVTINDEIDEALDSKTLDQVKYRLETIQNDYKAALDILDELKAGKMTLMDCERHTAPRYVEACALFKVSQPAPAEPEAVPAAVPAEAIVAPKATMSTPAIKATSPKKQPTPARSANKAPSRAELLERRAALREKLLTKGSLSAAEEAELKDIVQHLKK